MPPSSSRHHIGYNDLLRDLRLAGIGHGEVLVVHSSLSKVGWITGGPNEVIRALREVIGESGTLVMPTFSFNMTGWDMPGFDPWRTASRVGRLTEVFWRTPGTIRTHHPTHSVAASGRLAREITAGPINYEPLGIGSPLDRARQAGAKILLMGVTNNRNSTVHLAESLAEMPYLRVPFTDDGTPDTAYYLDRRGGDPIYLQINETPGSSEGFDVLDDLLMARQVSQRVMIGAAQSFIMESSRLCDVVVEELKNDPYLLLSGEAPSAITLKRRRYMDDYLSQKPVTS